MARQRQENIVEDVLSRYFMYRLLFVHLRLSLLTVTMFSEKEELNESGNEQKIEMMICLLFSSVNLRSLHFCNQISSHSNEFECKCVCL
jgi:hypothetical protein